MLKRGICQIVNRSPVVVSSSLSHQFLGACSYHTTQNVLEVRKVSIKPTTSSASTSTSSYKKTVSSPPAAAPSASEDVATSTGTFQIRGSVNSVQLVGTLAGDANIKDLPNGRAFTGITVVTSERIKKGENIEEQSTFHNVVSFNPILAKVAAKFFKKGTIVSVKGSLKYREVEKDGVKHITPQVVVDDFTDAKVIYGKYNKE